MSSVQQQAVIQPTGINHLGIAVRSIAEVRDYYESVLGAAFEGIEEVPDQKVRVAFYRIGAGEASMRLELLEPTADDSPIAKFLETRGPGLHHIAFTVDSLEERLSALRREGLRLIDEEPRLGAHQTKIAFLHPKTSAGILTELCEPAKDR